MVLSDVQIQLVLEELPLLSTVPGVLRWMFRFHDKEGRDALETYQLRPVITASLSFITEKDLKTNLVNEILEEYEDSLVVCEEEFVFDVLNNCKIQKKLD